MKNIVASSLFIALYAISAIGAEFIELDCSKSLYSACKGRRYEIETQFNHISSRGQVLWTFQDPAVDHKLDPFQEPLMDYEYNDLKVHTSSVSPREGGYFSSMLIIKFEIDDKYMVLRRTIQTFLSQVTSSGGGTSIYAWVDRESFLLDLLKTYYGFRESQATLFVPIEGTKVSLPQDRNVIQLEANKKDIIDLFR